MQEKNHTWANRRDFIRTAGVTGCALLAGCAQQSTDGDGGGAGESPTTTAEPVGTTASQNEDGTNIEVVSFTDSWVPEGNIAPLIHALDEGWYAENGISLQYTRGYGSSETGKKVGQKKTDIGFAGLTATASLVQQGLDLVWVAPLIPRPMSSIHVHPDVANEISSLSDLEGRPGAHAPGDVAWIIAQAAFSKENLDVDSMSFETTWSFMSLLAEWKVDFAVGWSTNSTGLWYSENPIEPKIMPLSPIIPAYGNGFVVHRDYLEENRDTIRNFLEVTYRSYNWVYENRMSGVKTSIDKLLKYFEELTLGESGTRKTHEAMLQMFLAVLLADHVKTQGLGHPHQPTIDSTFEIINNYIVDGTIEPDEVVIDDPIIKEGEFVPPNFDSHKEWLKTIKPGNFDNPYY